MKKVVFSVASVLLLGLLLAGCDSGGPKDNAEKFLTAFFHMDFTAAKDVSTEESKKQLDFLEGLNFTPSRKEVAKKIKVTVKDPKIVGDSTATVEYFITDDPSPKTLRMVKLNGKWLVQWSKLDLIKLSKSSVMSGTITPDSLIGTPTAPPMDSMNLK
jgi:hypothetical protein